MANRYHEGCQWPCISHPGGLWECSLSHPGQPFPSDSTSLFSHSLHPKQTKSFLQGHYLSLPHSLLTFLQSSAYCKVGVNITANLERLWKDLAPSSRSPLFSGQLEIGQLAYAKHHAASQATVDFLPCVKASCDSSSTGTLQYASVPYGQAQAFQPSSPTMLYSRPMPCGPSIPSSLSVRRSSPRTTKRPRTGPDRTDLGPDRSPGPASVLNGPVLILNFSGKLRTSPGQVRTGFLPLFNRGSN